MPSRQGSTPGPDPRDPRDPRDGAAREHLAREFARIALEAGRAIMEVYTSPFAVRAKADESPVTDADERAERVILAALRRVLPGVEIVSEESFDAAVLRERGLPDEFVLVDPLDGTREFVGRNGEFTVNIALVERGRPVVGCVHAPASNETWFGAERAYFTGGGDAAAIDSATPIRARARPADSPPIVLASRSHRDAATTRFLDELGPAHIESVGSSLKFCRLASGRADLYPRFGPTMEWDTAAGHAVLAAAGGRVETPDSSAFVYGKVADGLRNGAFVASGL